jgi:hypothetical protein
MFSVQMATYRSWNVLLNSLCTTYTDISFWLQPELSYLPCWLACRLGLAAACCHAYSSASTQVYLISALGHDILPTTPCHPLALAPRVGGRDTGSAGGSWRLHPWPSSSGCRAPVRLGGRSGGVGGGVGGCVLARRCSCILLVLDLALDDLELVVGQQLAP